MNLIGKIKQLLLVAFVLLYPVIGESHLLYHLKQDAGKTCEMENGKKGAPESPEIMTGDLEHHLAAANPIDEVIVDSREQNRTSLCIICYCAGSVFTSLDFTGTGMLFPETSAQFPPYSSPCSQFELSSHTPPPRTA